jgi:hypothetical protein
MNNLSLAFADKIHAYLFTLAEDVLEITPC